MPGQPHCSISDKQLQALRTAISPARFSTYERMADSDDRRAVALYLWNAHVAEAFYFPLQTNEVLLRNAIAGALARIYGSKWPFSASFQNSLPDKLRGNLTTALTPLVGRVNMVLRSVT
jgi:hypothetical protein